MVSEIRPVATLNESFCTILSSQSGFVNIRVSLILIELSYINYKKTKWSVVDLSWQDLYYSSCNLCQKTTANDNFQDTQTNLLLQRTISPSSLSHTQNYKEKYSCHHVKFHYDPHFSWRQNIAICMSGSLHLKFLFRTKKV